jgi:opacity protein-like surface antigen
MPSFAAQNEPTKTMKKLAFSRTLVIPALFFCTLATSQLQAADSNWYLKADVGPSFANNLNTTTSFFGANPTTTHLSFKTGVRLDLDGGYQFDDSWAVGMEVGYIYNAVDFSNSTQTGARSLYQVPILVNGTYTLPVNWRVKPYVGLGLGGIVSGLNDLHDINGAGQFVAGVKYSLNPRIDLGLAYKLLATTKHDWNDIFGTTQANRTIDNSILATVTFKF